MLLKGKTALITGCLRGIGRDSMDLFARQGANIVACCQYEDVGFAVAVQQLAIETGVTITPLYFDLANPDQIKAGMKQVASSRQTVDILLNIAGIAHDSLFHMTSMDSLRSVFEINFFSQMIITQYVTKLMMRHRYGSVIMVSSITGIDGNPGQLSYSASKAALIGATKTLALELAEHNIRVNAIAPGVINTDMLSHIRLWRLSTTTSTDICAVFGESL